MSWTLTPTSLNQPPNIMQRHNWLKSVTDRLNFVIPDDLEFCRHMKLKYCEIASGNRGIEIKFLSGSHLCFRLNVILANIKIPRGSWLLKIREMEAKLACGKNQQKMEQNVKKWHRLRVNWPLGKRNQSFHWLRFNVTSHFTAWTLFNDYQTKSCKTMRPITCLYERVRRKLA